MRLWIDGDSCPALLREFLLRSCEKRGILLYFVTVQPIRLPNSPAATLVRIAPGDQSVDGHILAQARPGEDLVLTRDIPLAEELVNKGVAVLNPGGVLYTHENVHARKLERDLKAELRQLGMLPQRGSSYSKKDLGDFANAWDRVLRSMGKG